MDISNILSNNFLETLKSYISKIFFLIGKILSNFIYLFFLFRRETLVLIREDRIGHQIGTLDSELYLATIRKKNKNENTVFLLIEDYDNLANKHFRKICPEIIKRFGFKFIIINFKSNLILFKRFLRVYISENPRFYRSSITFTPHLKRSLINSSNTSLNILKKLNLEKNKYICIYCRDTKYLNERFPNVDWKYHDHRNSNIDNMELLAKYITENLKIEVVRIGSNVEKAINWSSHRHPKIIDYSRSKYCNEKNDIDLIASSLIYISSSGGPESIAVGSRRPMIRFNQSPMIYELGYEFGIYLPKLIRYKKDGKILSIRKVKELGLASIWKPDYESFNLILEENSDVDILNAFKDYINYKNKSFSDEENRTISLYKKLRIENESKGIILKGINNFIAPSFLLKYPELLN